MSPPNRCSSAALPVFSTSGFRVLRSRRTKGDSQSTVGRNQGSLTGMVLRIEVPALALDPATVTAVRLRQRPHFAPPDLVSLDLERSFQGVALKLLPDRR